MSDNHNMHFKRLAVSSVAAMIWLLLVTACSTTVQKRSEFGTAQPKAVTQDRLDLVQIARNLIGVPYRYGSAEPGRGLDCSGLVFYSYREVGVSVPRTASQQRRHSAPVAASALRPGDLVFFDTRAKSGHVGIYSGQGRFIHAPSNGGKVREEKLGKSYWRKRWVGGGNFLDG